MPLTADRQVGIDVVPYSGVTPAGPITLDFGDNLPRRVKSCRSTITAGPAIVLASVQVLLPAPASTFVTFIPIIPWQFAATTVTTTTPQAPDVSITALFGPAISGFIPSGLRVFDGWQLQFNDFLATPGVIFDLELEFTRDG